MTQTATPKATIHLHLQPAYCGPVAPFDRDRSGTVALGRGKERDKGTQVGPLGRGALA